LVFSFAQRTGFDGLLVLRTELCSHLCRLYAVCHVLSISVFREALVTEMVYVAAGIESSLLCEIVLF
jgi:hypothetical protein